MDSEQAKRISATYLTISRALERGALTPRSAVQWAARAGRGADISVVAALTGSEYTAAANRRVRAHSNSQLAQQILSLLGQAADGGDPADDEFSGIFPPTTTSTTLIYDAPDEHGIRPKPSTVPSVEETGTSNRYTPYASAGRSDRYDDADRITDRQADTLYPATGRTAAESAQASAIGQQEARERDAAIRAGALEPYSDDDLLGVLFGDST